MPPFPVITVAAVGSPDVPDLPLRLQKERLPLIPVLYSLVAFLVDRRLAEKDLPVETEHYTAPLPEQETEPEKPEKTSENL